MILVIDIGNTNIELAGVEGDAVIFSGKLPTDRSCDAAEYRQRMAPVLSGVSFQGAILSSVVPDVSGNVLDAVEALTGMRPMELTNELKTGLTIALPQPERIGRDRLADAAWAAANFPLPAVTADLGTATTVNVILPGKEFAGGIICPGVQTMLHSLADRAAQLPRLEAEPVQTLIGRDTRECMLSGAVIGTAAMLDGLVQRIEDAIGAPVTFLLTGGGARYVAEHLHHAHIDDPDLLKKGLALIYSLNFS